MVTTPDTPTPPGGPGAAAPQPATVQAPPAPVPHSPAAQSTPAIVRSLSPRVTAALAGLMLAVGLALGAAIGPAPSTSIAGGSRIPLMVPSLLAAAGVGQQARTPSAQPTLTPPATPSAGAGSKATTSASSTPAPTSAATPPASTPAESTPPSPPTPTAPPAGGNTPTLAPATHVWLIELAGSTFANALAQPSVAPYIDGQAIPAGTLLSGWTALAANAFASETALLASTPPQLIETLTEPPCPEGAAGAQCAPGTPGELAAADAFLSACIPTITSTVAYREHGLIVVTFGSIAAGSASGLPAGSSSATLTSQPPAGVLLISPFASPGGRPATAFNPTSPKQSVEKLLRR
jgi:hypothetical protein